MMGSHKDIYRFSFEKVSCSPGWPQLVTAKDDPAPLLSASASQVRGSSYGLPHLLSVVAECNSGLMQLGELCLLSGRASPGSLFFWSHFTL